MTIASFQFLLFAALVALLYNTFTSMPWRRCILLSANLYYLWTVSNDLSSFVPLAAFVGLGFVGLHLIQAKPHASSLGLLIGAIVLTFLWLKKYTFLPTSAFLGFPYVTLGLSYIMFRILHMLIDARDGNLTQRVKLIDYINYMLNYQTIVAGPIQRYQDFAASKSRRPHWRLTAVSFGLALERIVVGFFKIVVPSAWLAGQHASEVAMLGARQPFSLHVETAVLAAATYTVYLYFNFSGYTDLVIGVGRLVGIELPENFDRPFASRSFIELWSRWHMTLSNFLKAYLYTPIVVTLMRRYTAVSLAPLIGIVGFIITFFVMGIWHGQTSIFFFYGFLLAAGVSVNKLYQVVLAKWLGRKTFNSLNSNRLYQALCRGLTFTWFSVCLFCFWTNWEQFWEFFGALGLYGSMAFFGLLWGSSTMALSGLALARSWFASLTWRGESLFASRYVRTVEVTVLACAAVGCVLLLQSAAPEIIYKKF